MLNHSNEISELFQVNPHFPMLLNLFVAESLRDHVLHLILIQNKKLNGVSFVIRTDDCKQTVSVNHCAKQLLFFSRI